MAATLKIVMMPRASLPADTDYAVSAVTRKNPASRRVLKPQRTVCATASLGAASASFFRHRVGLLCIIVPARCHLGMRFYHYFHMSERRWMGVPHRDRHLFFSDGLEPFATRFQAIERVALF
jgi:hypothetical protein